MRMCGLLRLTANRRFGIKAQAASSSSRNPSIRTLPRIRSRSPESRDNSVRENDTISIGLPIGISSESLVGMVEIAPVE